MDHPVLYSLDQDLGTTKYHTNIQAEKNAILNSSTDMLSLMQDIIDYSGPIALNIRMKDLEAARNDLDEYARKYKNLDKLVINLEMNESEIQDFTNNTRLQDDLYRELMNSSYSLNELKRLEFRYRDKNDVAGMTTVAYQGKALQKKIQSIQKKYQINSQNIINQSEKYNLDSTEVKKAQKEVDAFVQEVTSEQENSKYEMGGTVPRKISLLIDPDEGIYRDSITYSGFITGTGISNANISILLDNSFYTNIFTDEIGQFRKKIEIEQIAAGVHEVSARWNGISSDSSNLMIIPVNSTITLDVKAIPNQPVINATGLLITNRTVRYAPVDLIINNEGWKESYTNQKGNYSANLTLPKGTYTIYSKFSEKSFPINASSSGIYEVVSSGTEILSIKKIGNSESLINSDSILIIGIIIGIILVFITLTGVYLFIFGHSKPEHAKTFQTQDREWEKPFSIVNVNETDDQDIIENISSAFDETILNRYQIIVKDHNLSEGARYIYIKFLEKIQKDIQISVILALTPREVINKIIHRPYSAMLTPFIERYEKIRYAGSQGEMEKKKFEELVHQTYSILKEVDNEK